MLFLSLLKIKNELLKIKKIQEALGLQVLSFGVNGVKKEMMTVQACFATVVVHVARGGDGGHTEGGVCVEQTIRSCAWHESSELEARVLEGYIVDVVRDKLHAERLTEFACVERITCTRLKKLTESMSTSEFPRNLPNK